MGFSRYSPWAVSQSETPKWRPGEQLASAAIIGMIFYLFFDVNVAIYRNFRKGRSHHFRRWRGLYFWSMNLGIWGILMNAIGVILRFMVPNSTRIWPAYTLLLTLGWTIFAPAQLLVLYSRLFIINHNEKLHRLVLYLILSTFVFFILPTWVTVWPAFNPDPKLSDVWSPRDAIVERCTQIGESHSLVSIDILVDSATGFTLIEGLISGIYIRSLLKTLPQVQFEVSVCHRRVKRDLVFVNIAGLTLDLINIVFLYLNQSGFSHPIQTFSYALKLKLEFAVLNQLMVVATRGRGNVRRDKQRGRPGSRKWNPFGPNFRNRGFSGDPPPSKEPQVDEQSKNNKPIAGFETEIARPSRLPDSLDLQSPERSAFEEEHGDLESQRTRNVKVQVQDLSVPAASAEGFSIPPMSNLTRDMYVRSSDVVRVTPGSSNSYICMASQCTTRATQSSSGEEIEVCLCLDSVEEGIEHPFWVGQEGDRGYV